MQGHRPTGYVQTPAQTATSGTTQNVNRDWTCKRWFNNIADKVTAKTHQYFGKFVAVATLPFTFIPSLACDLFYGAKSLYQRTVSKAPVQSQVSTRGTPASRPEATQRQSGNPVLPTSVEPEIHRVHPTANPAIEQLRQEKLYWKQMATALEASANESSQELATQKKLVQNLEHDLEHQRLIFSRLGRDFQQVTDENNNLRKCLEEQKAIEFRQFHELNDLKHNLIVLNYENNALKVKLDRLENFVPPVDQVRTTDEMSFSGDESLSSSTDEGSGTPSNATFIVEEVDDSPAGDGADTHPAHEEATAEHCDTKDANDGYTGSSGESFENINAPELNTVENATTS